MLNKKKPLLMVVSAPSGAGKTSLCREVVARVPDLVHSVSYTTRPPRRDEQEGVDYHFVSYKEFHQMAAAGEFAEWAEVHGNFYGTSIKLLQDYWAQKKDVILDIDVQGAIKLRARFPEAAFVFVVTPQFRQLEERLRARRTEPEEILQGRLKKAQEEIRYYRDYDYLIVNDEFEQAVEDLEAIILAERRRLIRWQPNFLDNYLSGE